MEPARAGRHQVDVAVGVEVGRGERGGAGERTVEAGAEEDGG